MPGPYFSSDAFSLSLRSAHQEHQLTLSLLRQRARRLELSFGDLVLQVSPLCFVHTKHYNPVMKNHGFPSIFHLSLAVYNALEFLNVGQLTEEYVFKQNYVKRVDYRLIILS